MFLTLGFAPMVLLSVIVYLSGVRSVETQLRSGVENEAIGCARDIEATLRECELEIAALANSTSILDYLRASDGVPTGAKAPTNNNRVPDKRPDAARRVIPADVRESTLIVLLSNPKSLGSLTFLGSSGHPLFRAELVNGDNSTGDRADARSVHFQTEDILASTVKADPRVWTTSEPLLVRSPISKEANGVKLRYSFPIFLGDAGPQAPRGALVAELNGDALFEAAMKGRSDDTAQPDSPSDSRSSQRFFLMLDHEGLVLFHSNETFRHQSVSYVMSSFKDVSSAMMAGESGLKFYDAEYSRWLVAYRPVASLNASVGVAGNYTTATSSVKRFGLSAAVLLALFGLATVLVLAHILKNTARSIERVTEGAVAIAGGKLDQRIEVRSNDETRILAESFNTMTDRLREQIARETESRQFESFVRLSAMLTHDLKNAIAGLSLLVGNMERQFHREEFRADAMKSLTESTVKLRRLVSKLSEPVQTLSSEHKLARPTDLVPIINRVLTTTVHTPQTMHEIDVQLPKELIATVESDRIEKVFENLIINAVEAMGAKRGKLSVTAGPANDGQVYFSVSDTGPGMSTEFQRTKLFRAFATTKTSGVGLGLYTCREIVQAHGGRIEVESRRGSGATFRVVLPSVPLIMESV